MSKKTIKKGRTIASQTAMIIAVVTFIIGFFSGIGFTIFKTTPTEGVASNVGTSVDYDKLTKELEAEVATNPENTEAWVQLGHVYFDTNKYKKAIFAYERSLSLNPNNSNVLTDLGIMYRRNGQPEKAVEKFDKAIIINPQHESARFNKGIVLMHDLGDRDGAIQAWEELLEINPVAMASNGQSVDQLVTHYKEGHVNSK